MKIYCGQCKYYKPGEVHFCTHPKNKVVKWLKEDFYGPKRSTVVGQKTTPDVINKNNDCPWFKKYEIVESSI